MFRFETPLALLALLTPLAVYLWKRFARRRRAAVLFSSIENAKAAGHSWRNRLCRLPEVLRWSAFVLLVLAVARPQAGREQTRKISQGIAIEMVLDKSTSMSLEMKFEGQFRSRLEVAKEMFSRFVFGYGRQLSGRPNDLIGMISFAMYSDTVCPLTLSHAVLKPFLKSITFAEENEDGTAIGDAMALAAARLYSMEQTLDRRQNGEAYIIKSKVMILLTDGENNRGMRTVKQAGELARKWGIRVYVIALGGDGYLVRGNVRHRYNSGPVNTDELKKIAADTGGLFRMAEDADALEQAYQEIDKLERSDVESVSFTEYRELYAPLALAGFVLLLLEQLLLSTCFRRLP